MVINCLDRSGRASMEVGTKLTQWDDHGAGFIVTATFKLARMFLTTAEAGFRSEVTLNLVRHGAGCRFCRVQALARTCVTQQVSAHCFYRLIHYGAIHFGQMKSSSRI